MSAPATLNARQRAFVDAIVIHGIAEKAAIDAGYARTTARSQAARLLANVGISAAIKEIQDAAHGKAIATFDEVCTILSSIARGCVGDYLDDDGRIDLDRVRTCHPEALQSLEQRIITGDKGEVITLTKFRLYSPIQAIQQLARMKGWDAPVKQDVNVVSTFADLVLEAAGEGLTDPGRSVTV